MTKRGVLAMAFLLGGIALALVLDAGRLSWFVVVVGSIVAVFIQDREDEDRDGEDPARIEGARWYVGFAVIAAGGLVSVAFYPGWDAYAVIALFGCAAVAMRPLLLKKPTSPG